jgi:hypothetical protein
MVDAGILTVAEARPTVPDLSGQIPGIDGD